MKDYKTLAVGTAVDRGDLGSAIVRHFGVPDRHVYDSGDDIDYDDAFAVGYAEIFAKSDGDFPYFVSLYIDKHKVGHDALVRAATKVGFPFVTDREDDRCEWWLYSEHAARPDPTFRTVSANDGSEIAYSEAVAAPSSPA